MPLSSVNFKGLSIASHNLRNVIQIQMSTDFHDLVKHAVFTDAVTDLTMISTANVSSGAHFAISCINGERSPAPVDLDITRDNKIFILSKPPNFKLHKRRNKVLEARDFRDFEHIGIFYCESTQEVPPLERITMINNFNRGERLPSTIYTPGSWLCISFMVFLLCSL